MALLDRAIIIVYQEEGRESKSFLSCSTEKLALGFINGNQYYPARQNVCGIFEMDEWGRTAKLIEKDGKLVSYYAELEKEHLGDPDKQTGIYHPEAVVTSQVRNGGTVQFKDMTIGPATGRHRTDKPNPANRPSGVIINNGKPVPAIDFSGPSVHLFVDSSEGTVIPAEPALLEEVWKVKRHEQQTATFQEMYGKKNPTEKDFLGYPEKPKPSDDLGEL